jgi:hypothetical protein
MSKQFGRGLSDAQMRLARRISDTLKEEPGENLSYSQVVKAFERGENARIEDWKARLVRQTLETASERGAL